MNCCQCKCEESKVIDSRPSLGIVRRRRECVECHTRFTTHEIQTGEHRTDYRVNQRLFVKGITGIRERILLVESYLDDFIQSVRLGDLDYVEDKENLTDWSMMDFAICQQSQLNIINSEDRKAA